MALVHFRFIDRFWSRKLPMVTSNQQVCCNFGYFYIILQSVRSLFLFGHVKDKKQNHFKNISSEEFEAIRQRV